MFADSLRPINVNERECNIMASDFVAEFLIKRNKGKKSALSAVGIVVGAVAVVAGVFALSYIAGGQYAGLALIASVAAVGLAVYLLMRLNLEFEYTFFSGDLTIDKIYNQNSRAGLAEFSLRQVEEMGRFDPETFRGSDTRIICTSDEDGKGGIYLKMPNNVVTLGKNMTLEGSYIIVVIEDNEGVRENLKSFLRPSVYREGMKSFS